MCTSLGAGFAQLSSAQAHTCANLLEMPDYWAALSASYFDKHNVQDSNQVPDLEAELATLIDQRLKTAVSCCCTYENAGPASKGGVL